MEASSFCEADDADCFFDAVDGPASAVAGVAAVAVVAVVAVVAAVEVVAVVAALSVIVAGSVGADAFAVAACEDLRAEGIVTALRSNCR